MGGKKAPSPVDEGRMHPVMETGGIQHLGECAGTAGQLPAQNPLLSPR